MTARYVSRSRSSLQRALVAALLVAVCSLTLAPAASATLPDARAYELVSPVEENAVAPYAAVPSVGGEAVDFQARGAFAGASSGSLNLYQASRVVTGWQTTPLTPTPPSPLGPLEEQVPLFYSPDLSQTIFTTPESYEPGDDDGGALDLYLRSSDGALTWLSQGPEGDSAPDEVTFDGATPDASSVLFSSAESLLPAAGELEPGVLPPPEYLYDRLPSTSQTQLVDVDEAGRLIGGASSELTASFSPSEDSIALASTEGFRDGETVTVGEGASAERAKVRDVEPGLLIFASHALSSAHAARQPVTGQPAGAVLGDGTSLTSGPPPASQYLPADVTGTTTHALSSDSSRIFFESPSPQTGQTVSLYMREDDRRTVLIAASRAAGERPPEPSEQVRFEGASETGSLVFYTYAHGLYAYDAETATARTIAPSVLGVTAISSDGSRIYFVSDALLASNANSQGAAAAEGEPNLYVYDTSTGSMTFIATVASSDVEGEGHDPAGLVAEPDIDRPAVPTPDGSVLVFAAHGNLTGQNPAERYAEIYRYSVAEGQLVCVSCTRAGLEPTGNATFGETAGGTYDPPGLSSPISANGDEVFFDTPDSLVPEDQNQDAPPDPLTGEPGSTDVYEWEGGEVHLISCGCTASASTLQGTTPSGDDVFFATTAKLVPQATGFVSLYDARVGDGFPPPPNDAPPSCTSGCREAFIQPPPLAAPASTTVQGPGNLPTAMPPKPKPLVCRKGTVKKRVKKKTICVKKKAKGATAAHRTDVPSRPAR
jgi:hypothetical protein